MTKLRQSQYARLRGCTAQAVSAAVKSGRISLDENGFIDVERADLMWPRSVEDTGERLDPGDPSFTALQESRARAEAARARLMELTLAEREGRLVDAARVRSEAFKLARDARNQLQQVPTRLAPLIAAESDPEKVIRMLELEFNEICRQLARPGDGQS